MAGVGRLSYMTRIQTTVFTVDTLGILMSTVHLYHAQYHHELQVPSKIAFLGLPWIRSRIRERLKKYLLSLLGSGFQIIENREDSNLLALWTPQSTSQPAPSITMVDILASEGTFTQVQSVTPFVSPTDHPALSSVAFLISPALLSLLWLLPLWFPSRFLSLPLFHILIPLWISGSKTTNMR